MTEPMNHPRLAEIYGRIEDIGVEYRHGEDGDPDWLSIPTGYREAIDVEPYSDADSAKLSGLTGGETRPCFAVWFRVWDGSGALASEEWLATTPFAFTAQVVRAAVAAAEADNRRLAGSPSLEEERAGRMGRLWGKLVDAESGVADMPLGQDPATGQVVVGARGVAAIAGRALLDAWCTLTAEDPAEVSERAREQAEVLRQTRHEEWLESPPAGEV